MPRVYVTPPQDGVQDFDFVAVAPEGIVLWVMSPLSADCTVQLEQWMTGIRVHSATGSITAELNDPACAVGQGRLDDYVMPKAGGTGFDTTDGPSEPRLPGNNGGATGRPGGR